MRIRIARQRMGEGRDIDMEQHMGHGPIQWKKTFWIFFANVFFLQNTFCFLPNIIRIYTYMSYA